MRIGISESAWDYDWGMRFEFADWGLGTEFVNLCLIGEFDLGWGIKISDFDWRIELGIGIVD